MRTHDVILHLSLCGRRLNFFTARRYGDAVYAVVVNRAGYWHGRLLSPMLHCVLRKFGYPQNKGTSLWKAVPIRTWEISPQQVDRIVNKGHRRSS